MQAYYGLTQAPNYQLQSLHASFFFSFCLVEINIFILLGKTIYTTNKAQGILQWSRYNFFSLRTTNNVKPISTKQKQQGSGYKSSLWPTPRLHVPISIFREVGHSTQQVHLVEMLE